MECYTVHLERSQLQEILLLDIDPAERVFSAIVHPSPTAGALAINYPARDGSSDGPGGKYAKLASRLASAGAAAVVRLENKPIRSLAYQEKLLADLRDVAVWARSHAWALCGDADPDLYLIGTSVGASACAALASELGASKLVLFAPLNEFAAAQRSSLGSFRGDVFLIVGDRDAKALTPERVLELAPHARVSTCILRDCDHHFRGTINHRHMIEIPTEVLASNPRKYAKSARFR